MRVRRAGRRLGAALVEAALCLALFTPIVLAGLRLAQGANQLHELADAASAAARAGGACASEDEIRRLAIERAPGLEAGDVRIEIDRTSDPAAIRVSLNNARVMRLYGPEQLTQAPWATFPYACE